MTVEDLLKKNNIPFKVSGRDFLVKCFNPEHEDSNPSMRIDRVLGIYHCLACGYKGNLFKLYDAPSNTTDILREELKRKITKLMQESAGIEFPKNCIPAVSAHRVSLETLLEFEAFTTIEKGYEDRLVFPIRDLKDKIVAFIGRDLSSFSEKKYMVYPHGTKLPLFPMSKIQPINGRAMLVEGIFDMLNMWEKGFHNCLCSFGTNAVTHQKLELLKLRGISGLDIMFDADDAGKKAAEEIREMAKDLFDVRIVTLKEGDPGEIKPKFAEKLKEKLYG